MRTLLLFLLLLGSAHAGTGEMGAAALPEPTTQIAPADEVSVSIPAGWVSRATPYAEITGDPADEATLTHLAQHLSRVLPDLAAQLGLPVPDGMRVIVAPSEALFRDLQPGRTPDWADGTAWPQARLIFLRSPHIRPGTATALTTVLEHELVHVILGAAFGDRPVPTWLQEGTAKLLAREMTADMNEAIALGALGDDLLSLPELTRGFPRDPARARLAYAQSADFLAWMRNTYGPASLPTLVTALAGGLSVDQSLMAATGHDAAALDADWRGRILSSPLRWSALANTDLWFGLVALLFVVGGTLRLRRSRKKLARMEAEERWEDMVRQAMVPGGPLAHLGQPPPGNRPEDPGHPWIH